MKASCAAASASVKSEASGVGRRRAALVGVIKFEPRAALDAPSKSEVCRPPIS